jgi:catechol 2,3-dioxygenase-like lactoylglutathione lyase family enzyme
VARIDGVHHVKLPVSDVGRSRAWYERVLGFELVMELVEDGEVRGVALQWDACPPQLALRHDPDRAKALAGFDALALLVSHLAHERRRSGCVTVFQIRG